MVVMFEALIIQLLCYMTVTAAFLLQKCFSFMTARAFCHIFISTPHHHYTCAVF